MAEKLELKKRVECYVLKPDQFSIKCDICGGTNIHWSEYEHLIWCYDCEKDTKGTGGIFDGPIPVKVCELMGIVFDKYNIETGEHIRFNTETGEYEST